MRKGFGWRHRVLAGMLALATLLSCVHFSGVAQVRAEDGHTVTGAQLVAENYSQLTAEEKELLILLGAGGSFTYAVPDKSDELVSIDTAAKTITAQEYTYAGLTWKPAAAQLQDLSGQKLEDVALSGGKGSYAAAAESFAVQVTYVLKISLDTDVQDSLLSSLRDLASGKKAADSVKGSMDDLDLIATAMDVLVQLRNGVNYSLGGGTVTVRLGAEARSAVDALNAQYKANGGKLDLQLCLEAYTAAPMAYLSTSAKKLHEAASATYEAVHALAVDSLFTSDFMDSAITAAMPNMASAWKSMKSAVKRADAALAPAAEAWAIADNAIIPTGLRAEEYTRMGTLADSLNAQAAIASGISLKQELEAARTVITCNSSMVDVQLRVELRSYDDTNTLVSTVKEQVESVEEGTSLSAVEASAAALEAQARKAFEEQGVDLSGYVRTVETDITGSLTGVTEAGYTIVYSPKACTLTFAYDGGRMESYGYGYRLTLEAYPESDKVYDYDIGGTYYPQNAVYTVAGDVTLSRTAMKPVTETDLLTIIANCYGTDKETAILTSGALLGNEAISLRYPDNDDGKLIVSEAGKLTVGLYNSGYKNKYWLPYSYTLGNQVSYFDGATSVTVSTAGLDSIPVVYRLELTDISADRVQTWLTDVKEMSAQAESQLEALELLNAQYSGMGQINKAVLNVLKNSIYDFELHEDWDTNEYLQDYLVEVIGNIVSDCVDTNGKLRIYNMLTKYRDANSGGLVYYYRNSESFIAEVELLAGYLSDMLGDELKINAVKVLMTEFGYPQYADRFTELEAVMNQVAGNLLPPHECINISSPNLDVLVRALTMSGTVGTTGAKSPYLEETFSVAAPNKATVQITVSSGNHVLGTVSATYELEDAYVLTQADVDHFRAQIQAIADANFKSRYYTEKLDVELSSLVGRVMDSSVLIKSVWTANTYTVIIEGMGSQTITVENPVITLPEPGIGFRNDYHVDGVICGEGSYRFTTDQLDRLFPNGSYTITVTKTNVAAERLETFLADLNEAGKGTMQFLLNDDKDTVTVNMAAGDQAALSGCIQEVALTMMGGYEYIGLNGQGMLYANEKGNTEISLQTVYDAVLHDDGFSHLTLAGLQDGEGILTVTTVQLGDSADRLEQDLTFVIYLTSVPDQIRSVGKALDQAQGNLTFQANNGVLEVEVNLQEPLYQSLLSGLLLTGRADKQQLNALSSGTATAFLLHCMDQLVSDPSITMTTFENTFTQLGWNVSLSGDQLYYEYIAGILRSAKVTEKEDGCELLQTIDIKAALDSAAGASMAPVLGTIKEYHGGGILVDLFVALQTRDGYQAMILDSQASESLSYTENLSEALSHTAGEPTVVLLADVTGDLSLPEGTVLDLNGFAVTGSITAQGAAAIVDSSRDTWNCGSVSGSLSGEITVLGGSFATDVTGFLKSGYIQDGGVVRDSRFSARRNADGSVTYLLHMDTPLRSNELALDIAVDMLLSGMSTAKLTVDGTAVYDLVRLAVLNDGEKSPVNADLTQSVLDALQTQGLGKLVAAVLEDLTNYAAAAKGQPLGTYAVTENLWEVELVHVSQGDYLNLNLHTSDRVQQTTVHTAMGGDSAAEQAKYLQELITGSQVELEYGPVEQNADGISALRGTGKALWNVDLTARREYATILGVILGYAHSGIRGQIAAAVNTGDTQALKNAFNSLTVDQLLQALEKLDPSVSFARMAAAVGVTVDVTAASEIAEVILPQLCSIGDDLGNWTVTGGTALLGTFEDAQGKGSYRITGLSFASSAVHTVGTTQLEASMNLTDVTIDLAGIHKAETYDVLDTKGNVVVSTNDAQEALNAAKNGCTLRINQSCVLNFWTVKTSFHVQNAGYITVGGLLLSKGVTVTSDAPLQVFTAASGYAVKQTVTGGTYTYTLEAVQAPTWGKDLAKVWVAQRDNASYLYVDADPTKGITLNALKESLSFAQFKSLGGTVKFTITGNGGTGLVKTGDKLTVTVASGSFELAKIEYTVVITGDVNRDGRVTAGDAVAMMKIYKNGGSAYTAAQLMAADTNGNGTAASPRIDAGDAVRIMKKYMDWNTYLAAEAGK